ncbi:Piso0_000840 [Millerozyma farinosa CBS 7064]|uniref:ethanolamine-phosphate cytidylyltransferase n=1 Tax=Pichia sorbitophila (strain ATCC MYA-4447 / BCRC 22081 / CBS 7064 / NBRC 10061 / NRRL Y-12695) TaxID=559304 RepID=G8YQ75_PICSO|nr:Piso0_000840 [Millerozyma farinosa CBS 7064]
MYERPAGIENSRIWIDGCFDFAHHGHAGAMLQARQIGRELFVGVHSDEEILHHKGPVVMHLDERLAAVAACKWSTQAVPDAPYVTAPWFIDKYGCQYVVHGDDITTDANGEDCYQEMKDLGRFVVVKRTPNISTTDLVGRMLLMSKEHHFQPIKESLTGHPLFTKQEYLDQFTTYASDASGLRPGSGVYVHLGGKQESLHELVAPSDATKQLYDTVFYIDGTFDVFHPGHIEALRVVKERAAAAGAAVVVGLYDDWVSNHTKGLNYPIMNLLERSLCVLQCRYVDGVILGAPSSATPEFFALFPGKVAHVFSGSAESPHPAVAAISVPIGPHKYDNINTSFIVTRVLDNRAAYEERQRRKGWKASHEAQLKDQDAS